MVSRIHAVVAGRVQGVGFRYATRSRALELGLVGFARNLDDGTVEIEAEGSDDALSQFRRWLDDERPMPASPFIRITEALGVEPSEVVRRARQRLAE